MVTDATDKSERGKRWRVGQESGVPYGLNRVFREGLTEEVTFQQSWKKMVEQALWISAAGASQGCGNRMYKGPEVGAGRLAHSSLVGVR